MNTTPQKSQRILSLDVFRGLTIILMILVNSQGNQYAYPVLQHAAWNGCTLADVVFPCFLFIVGLTTVISLKHQLSAKTTKALYGSIIQRSVILFFLGVLLNAIPYHFDLDTIRIYGILQRIAICYFICSLIYLNTSLKTQIVIFFAIIIGYWFFMTHIPVPGYGANQLTPQGSWVSYVDQLLFAPAHLFAKIYDPEGLISTIPSIATTLLGVLTGHLLLSSLPKQGKFYLMSFTGGLFLLAGWLWGFNFPINKDLWTSSFVLWTGGYALITFALCFLIIDIRGYTAWALPLKIFGMNALFAFILHVILLKIQSMFYLQLSNGKPGSLRAYLTDYVFGSFGVQNAALLYALSFILLNFLVVAVLYRHRVFIRI